MGAFAGENYDSISQLNKEVEEKGQDLQRSKHDQEQAAGQHQHEMQALKDKYEEKLRKIKE